MQVRNPLQQWTFSFIIISLKSEGADQWSHEKAIVSYEKEQFDKSEETVCY